jgi:hypothetical protein
VIGAVGMPIAARAGHIGIVHGHRQPQRIDSQIAKIVLIDFLKNARVVAAFVLNGSVHAAYGRAVIGRIAVQKAIDECEIHDGVTPIECAGQGGIGTGKIGAF